MKIHIVQKGDTLWNLAKKYDVNFEELKAANTQIANPDMVMPGMKIKVPGKGIQAKKEVQVKNKKAEPAKDYTAKEQPAPKKEQPKAKEAPAVKPPPMKMPKMEVPKKEYKVEPKKVPQKETKKPVPSKMTKPAPAKVEKKVEKKPVMKEQEKPQKPMPKPQPQMHVQPQPMPMQHPCMESYPSYGHMNYGQPVPPHLMQYCYPCAPSMYPGAMPYQQMAPPMMHHGHGYESYPFAEGYSYENLPYELQYQGSYDVPNHRGHEGSTAQMTSPYMGYAPDPYGYYAQPMYPPNYYQPTSPDDEHKE